MPNPAAECLIHAARKLEDEARRLRVTAACLIAAERQPDEIQLRVRKLHEAALRSEETGVGVEAATLGIPPNLLDNIAKRARAHRDRTAREIRDREIRTLARRGLSNADIALRFGISARTVARALEKERWKDA